MPDLSFQQLANKLPIDAIKLEGTDVIISVKLLTGESNITMSDPKVSEMVMKLLNACNLAQRDYNLIQANQANQLASFSAPSFGIPTVLASGEIVAEASYTTTVTIPLNPNEAMGSTV